MKNEKLKLIKRKDLEMKSPQFSSKIKKKEDLKLKEGLKKTELEDMYFNIYA